jgi:hypothetical protein
MSGIRFSSHNGIQSCTIYVLLTHSTPRLSSPFCDGGITLCHIRLGLRFATLKLVSYWRSAYYDEVPAIMYNIGNN